MEATYIHMYIWASSSQTIKTSSGVGHSLCWLYTALLATAAAGTCCALGNRRQNLLCKRQPRMVLPRVENHIADVWRIRAEVIPGAFVSARVMHIPRIEEQHLAVEAAKLWAVAPKALEEVRLSLSAALL